MDDLLKRLALKYFETFSNKDLDGLADMFADDVDLRDWNIQALGKTDVLVANKNIFNNVKTISVAPLELYRDNNTVVAEIEILVNGEEYLSVVDVIMFNDEGKIVSVRAYKG